MEVVRCDTCSRVYTDKGSIAIVKDISAENDKVPCPIMTCKGNLELKEQGTV